MMKRICKWERQSGKSTFIINDAIDWTTRNSENISVIVSPVLINLQHLRNLLFKRDNKNASQIYFFTAQQLRHNLERGKDYGHNVALYFDDTEYQPFYELQNVVDFFNPTMTTFVGTPVS